MTARPWSEVRREPRVPRLAWRRVSDLDTPHHEEWQASCGPYILRVFQVSAERLAFTRAIYVASRFVRDVRLPCDLDRVLTGPEPNTAQRAKCEVEENVERELENMMAMLSGVAA